MASERGKTKDVQCSVCNTEWVHVSLYSSDDKAVCKKCKRKTPSKTHKWVAKPERKIPLSEQQKMIREAIHDELDTYGIWEWLQVDNEDINMKYLNKLGEQGWKFAFSTDRGIVMHKLKDKDTILEQGRVKKTP